MKVAIPVTQGILHPHFGHSEQFAIFQVNPETKQVQTSQMLPPPPHEPGVLPNWLADQGVTVVLAGGLGKKAETLLASRGIEIVTGVPEQSPEMALQQYLDERLTTEGNPCTH